ncbi:MAG: GAF domain-containing sensor histidine kinase [Synechococcus sp.]|nr:GAF domain-containing sensor histidine kinase [Synechococcus sp.]
MGYSFPQLSAEQQQHFAYWQSLQADLIWLQGENGDCVAFWWQAAQDLDGDSPLPMGQKIFPQWFAIAPTEYTNAQQNLDQDQPTTLDSIFHWQQQTIPLKLCLIPLAANQLLGVGFHQPMGQAIDDQLSLSYQKALTQIARKIRSTLDLVVIRQEAVNGLGEMLQVSRCLLLTIDENQHSFRVEAEYRQGGLDSYLGLQWDMGNSPVLEQVYRTQQMQQGPIPGATSEEDEHTLVIPTFYQGSVNGLICLQQGDRPRVWQEVEQEFAQELAEQLGTAIAHATLYKQLEQLHHSATEATRLKNDFLASTTHELRTPLNGIIGFLKLILDDMADNHAEEREFIAAAHESALHLLNLINDILDIAKIESGKIDLDPQPISLSDLLENLNNFARPQLQGKALTWQITVPESHDEIVLYADYRRIFQVLLNLVSNAIKFTPSGGITIAIELVFKPITYARQQFPGMAKISVIDTGIGVALDMQSKLFQNFSQVRGGHTRQYGGTGLGLAISKKLVEACGGKISFYSMGEGLGSTVTFSVPLHQKPLLKQANHQDPPVMI